MPRPEKLDVQNLEDLDQDLANADWTVSEDGAAIEKNFRFKSFADAMAFMNAVAWHAEAADHHPEWCNVYNRVDVRLTTHDAEGLTELDLDLARSMERTAEVIS